MDTIGAIQPAELIANQQSNRLEVFERLRYLAAQQRCGVLVGRRGTGKSELLQQLKIELECEGISGSVINLAGVCANELPSIVAAELGLGGFTSGENFSTWTRLQDYAIGAQQSSVQHVFLFDQIDRAAAELALSFERLLSLFDSTFACIFATRPKYHASFRSLFKNHSWLKVDLERLSDNEVSQAIGKHLADDESEVQISKEAVEEVKSAAAGRVDKLKRLTELAILAAEAEEIRVINEDLIRSIRSELKVK